MIKKENLKNYQIDALASIRKARAYGNDRALVVMATGLGKTAIVAFDIISFLRKEEGKCLFLCHSNDILQQDMQEICSIFGNSNNCGLFNYAEKNLESKILFASIKSVYMHMDLFNPYEFAYIVVDEAHHVPAKMYKKVLSYFRPRFLLGVTATPNRLDGMSLNATFGHTVYSLELPEAIRKGLLAKINYHLVLDELINLEKDPIGKEEIFIQKSDEEISRIILEKNSESNSMLVFCTTIEHANNMHELLPSSGIMHSARPAAQNAATLEKFRRGEISTIISVDMLNEGVNIPHADMIVFLRSTMSPTIFYQQLGRGLRKCQGKDSVAVYDFVGNVDRINTINKLSLKIKQGGSNKFSKNFNLQIEAKQFANCGDIGLEFITQKVNSISQKISIKKEMIEEVRQFAEDLGRTPTEQEYANDVWVEHKLDTVKRLFGNYENFLRAAGFEIFSRKITRSEALREFAVLGERMLATARIPEPGDLLRDIGSSNFEYCIEKYGSWDAILDCIFESVGLITISEAEHLAWQGNYRKTGRFSEKDFEKIVGSKNRNLYWQYYGSWENFRRTKLISAKEVSLLREITGCCGGKENCIRYRVPTLGELVKNLSPDSWSYYKKIYTERETFISHLQLVVGKNISLAPAVEQREHSYIKICIKFLNDKKEVKNVEQFAKLFYQGTENRRSIEHLCREINRLFGSWDNFLDCSQFRKKYY